MYNLRRVMNRAEEHVLVRRAKEGDDQAIADLIRAHQDGLYAFILRMSGRPEVAEDIVQEAFVRVLKNLRRFDSRFRFSTWLFTIARRLYLNASQKLGPSFDTESVSSRATTDPGPGQETAYWESVDGVRDLLVEALAILPQQQREVILLFHQLNWPIAEIGEHLHMPLGTVKSHLHRGRARMKRMIMADPVTHRQAQEALS